MARILVSLPDEMLSNIDKLAEYEKRTRSELIRQMYREYTNKIINKNSELNAKKLEDLLTY